VKASLGGHAAGATLYGFSPRGGELVPRHDEQRQFESWLRRVPPGGEYVLSSRATSPKRARRMRANGGVPASAGEHPGFGRPVRTRRQETRRRRPSPFGSQIQADEPESVRPPLVTGRNDQAYESTDRDSRRTPKVDVP
jgi:hypothetical protein